MKTSDKIALLSLIVACGALYYGLTAKNQNNKLIKHTEKAIEQNEKLLAQTQSLTKNLA